MSEGSAVAEAIRTALADFDYEESEPGAFLVKLPGTHKLQTMTWLVVGEHALRVEAFFIRAPDENREAFYRWLLERNERMYGVSFALDNLGDVYLVGRLPLSGVSADEVDRLLGSVLSYADDWFDAALELGFRSAIEKEWDWRVKRGESLRNLEAFRRFAEPSNRQPRRQQGSTDAGQLGRSAPP